MILTNSKSKTNIKRSKKKLNVKLYINNKEYEKILNILNIDCFRDGYNHIDDNLISLIYVYRKMPICYLLAELKQSECMIWNVCTNSQYRSIGCMTSLFQQLFHLFPRYKKFSLYVRKSNNDAINLYKKMGFKIVKTNGYDHKMTLTF